MQLRLALPKGQLLPETSALLHRSGLQISGYDEQSRSYRPECRTLPGVFMKVFNEKDIPIQVAVGNYDVGICGEDWVRELLAKYPSSALVKIQDLGYGARRLCMAASRAAAISPLDGLKGPAETVRIATEYPNLAESFALRRRLRRFAIFPLWGAAEAYPPESADLALVSETADSPVNHDLVPVGEVLRSAACLVAHRPSWESRDLSPLLDRLCAAGPWPAAPLPSAPDARWTAGSAGEQRDLYTSGTVRLALPDGHQQGPALEFLSKAGIAVSPDPGNPRRPSVNLDGVSVKVIRPQDMPLQVANMNFDLAITGEDWLADHLCQFPSSPVRKLLPLGFGRVRIVAVVSRKMPWESPQDLQAPLRRQDMPLAGRPPRVTGALRIASEYINIADRYAREKHLSPCRLIPTWGATEAFLPEDADLLIENTQTGRTLAQHGLRIIDTLFESSACLIGRASAHEAGRASADEVGRAPADEEGGACPAAEEKEGTSSARQEIISGILRRLELALKET